MDSVGVVQTDCLEWVDIAIGLTVGGFLFLSCVRVLLWKRANLTQSGGDFCHAIDRLIPSPPREARQIIDLDLREIIKVVRHA